MNLKSFIKIASGLAIFSILIVFTNSCKKEDNSIGSDFLHDNKFITGIFRDSKLISFTSLNDTVVTSKSSLNLFGSFQDEIFGMTRSSFAIQMSLSMTDPDFGEEAVIDSVVLTIPYLGKNDTKTVTGSDGKDSTITFTNYETDSIFGDPSIPMEFKISEFNKILNPDSTYFSTIDLPTTGAPIYEDASYKANLHEITLLGHNIDGSVKDTTVIPAALRLKLPNKFFQERIFDKEGTAVLANNANFITDLNGLVFSTSSDNGAIFSLNMLSGSSLNIYYKSKNEDYDPEVEDSEELSKRDYELKFEAKYARVNKFEFDRDNYSASPSLVAQLRGDYDSTQGADFIYIQGMSGLEANIKLFTDMDQLKALRDSNWIINEASLVYRVSNENGKKFAPPYRLYMFNRDSMKTDNFRIIDEIAEPVAFDGFLRKDHRIFTGENRYYRFRITKHIHQLINGVKENIDGIDTITYPNNYPIKLVSVAGKESPSRVEINGNNAKVSDPNAKNFWLEIKHSREATKEDKEKEE